MQIENATRRSTSDSVADTVTPAERSRVMRQVRSSGSRAEQRFAELLTSCRVRSRNQVDTLPGRPDFVCDRLRLVIFVDGDFWHGRWQRRGGAFPKQNRIYWLAKLRRNRKRDREVDRLLRGRGWSVLRFWESDVIGEPQRVLRVLKKRLVTRRRSLSVDNQN
jgi:DNA mismatch endonuclease (patch repair protein)